MRQKNGFSLVEVLVASTILVLLFTSTIAASVMLRDVCSTGFAELELQRNLKNVLDNIVMHGPGENENNGLQSAVSYSVPLVGLTAPGASPGTEIRFVGTDGSERKYYLQGSAIMYQGGKTGAHFTRTVYTAPDNAALSLLFLYTSPDYQVVRVFLSVVQTKNDKVISGNLSTFVSLHNIPK